MPHADSLSLGISINSKKEFYHHVNSTLLSLISPIPGASDPVAGNWITILSNTASLLNGCYENFKFENEIGFGREDGERVNWCGFYLIPELFPTSIFSSSLSLDSLVIKEVREPTIEYLLLGPFAGRPACQEIPLISKSKFRPLGMCAKAYLSREAVIVVDVELEEGHIACDGATKSEIVIPIIVQGKSLGVLDIDCERIGAFGKDDKEGLELIVSTLQRFIRF